MSIENFPGFSYPITKNARGYWASQNGIDQIKSDMLILLLTYPGERVMLPTFGTPLKDLIFEPNDASVALQAKNMIAHSLNLYEPRISVDAINVSISVDQSILNPMDNLTETGAILTIQIQFRDPQQISTAQDLVLAVPLPGG